MIRANKVNLCHGCGKKIAFVKTLKGKTMPIDLEPVKFVPDTAGKNRYVLSDGAVVAGTEPREGDKDIHTGYISHFATCPQADYFRKRK